MAVDTSRAVIEFGGLRTGRVVVTFEPDLDPARWGYPLLGLPSRSDMARDFPVVHASVETESEGYASILAWVQVVSTTYLATGAKHRLVDVAPQLQGLEVPYVCFGARPTLFDAPSTDAEEDIDWIAHSFLVGSPDCVMSRHLVPLCGFSWGYQVRRRTPTPILPAEIGSGEWSVDQDLLRTAHPSWTFSTWRP